MSIKNVIASILIASTLVVATVQVAQGQTVNPSEGKAACELLGGTWNGKRCRLND